MLIDWASKIFLGPTVRTIQRVREETASPMWLGISTEWMNVTHNRLKEYRLETAPFAISEDGSSQQVRADIMEANDKLIVYGFNGDSVLVETAQEFNALMNDDSKVMATTLYVYTLVPLVDAAPQFPLFAISHDNSNSSLTTEMIQIVWSWFWKVSMPKRPTESHLLCVSMRPLVHHVINRDSLPQLHDMFVQNINISVNVCSALHCCIGQQTWHPINGMQKSFCHMTGALLA